MDTKKYIIEIPDNTAWLQWVKVSDKDGHVCFDFKDPEDLTPYTEPKKESCDKCMNEAEDLAYQLYSVKVDEAYQRGLNDAWDAARKIVLSREDGGLFGYEERKAVFGCGNYMALKMFLAPEAIEKIRQYEQEKEESVTTEGVMRQYLDTFCKGRICKGCPLNTPDFTCGRGHHFITSNPTSNEEVRRAYTTVIQNKGE